MKDKGIVNILKDGSLIIKRIGKKAGSELAENLLNPLLPKFNLIDVLQIIIGASILAVPVGFTEETWRLGESLPIVNIIILLFISIFFISLFVHLNYHRSSLKETWPVLLRRIFFTYFLSFLVVGGLLTIIQRAPWQTDFILAFKRVVIVTFPSSMSAVVADTLNK